MRTRSSSFQKFQRGYALMLTLAFASVAIVVLAGICRLASTESSLTARNIAYHNAVTAAEAATEVTIARMNRDFLHQSLSSDVSSYRGILPGAFVKGGWASDYRFYDGKGSADQSEIVCRGWQAPTNLTGEYAGLYGIVNSYEITSTAKRITGMYPVSGAVRQEFNLTAIPIFQFAIYYTLDLEITPGPDMFITGKTHGNADMYICPGNTLTFLDSVTYAGDVFKSRNPLEGVTSKSGTVNFSSDPTPVSSLTLPVGKDNDNNPSNVVQILDIPPVEEDVTSELGRQRYYNKSDLIITTKDKSVAVQYNNNEEGLTLSYAPTNNIGGDGKSGYSFVNTNATFYDYREKRQVVGTEIDIQALTNWLATSGFSLDVLAQAQTGHKINSIYVKDERSGAGKLTGVRVANGRYLPDAGLNVATPHPLYVLGPYNAPDLKEGETDTANTKPAALVSDAITILSPNWNDSWNATTELKERGSASSTVNAAFLSGIVETVEGHYSGGVENFPRFLENWDSKTLTYNGSMVVMFASRQATNSWINPGTYYNPPIRKWAFDKNFLDSTKLPPGTPQVKKLQRNQWHVVASKEN